MPYILLTEVDVLVGNGGWISIEAIDYGDLRVLGRSHILKANAVRKRPGQSLLDGTQCNDHVFQRIHADCFFPSEFVGIGNANGTVPTNAVDDLHVEQMEVDGMGIHAVVGNLPYLGFSVSEVFSRRIDVAQGDGGLGGVVGESHFRSQSGVHSAVVEFEEFLNGLA